VNNALAEKLEKPLQHKIRLSNQMLLYDKKISQELANVKQIRVHFVLYWTAILASAK
jgi:hypothetical protein